MAAGPDAIRAVQVPIADFRGLVQSAAVVYSLCPLVGVVVAVLLDWAIYTHLSAYLRIGFPSTPYASYRQIACGSRLPKIRTAAVTTTGITAGLSFTFELAWLWLAAVVLFAVAHSFLYVILYKAIGRS